MGHFLSCFEHDLAESAAVTDRTARRLVVFVHGWRGHPMDTWGGFPEPPDDVWWREADLLFVAYDSTKESMTASADRLRSRIGDFYPKPYEAVLTNEVASVRDDRDRDYEELIIVGHSLGAVVARRAVVDALDEWASTDYEGRTRPSILDARLRLFSPASAGFAPRGLLGAFRATPTWWVAEMFLRRGGAYPDLQPGSPVLVSTRQRTERYGSEDARAGALAAHLLWANPERVVTTERYDTDPVSRTMDGTDHRSVCKPDIGYPAPFDFVQAGTL